MKKLSLLNETHWGGMVRRSSSDVQRKENDVDNMSMVEFYGYLTSHYKEINQGIRCSKLDGIISIPLQDVKPYASHRLNLRYSNETHELKDIRISKTLREENLDIFDDSIFYYEFDGAFVFIKSDEMNVSNKMCLKVLDHILNRVQSPALEKIHK